MVVTIKRIKHDGQRVLGLLFIDGEFVCYTLENPSFAIPTGSHILGIQEHVTKMTAKYRKKFSWFKHHLHIKDVPNQRGIYLHIGNYPKDSRGCILVGGAQSFVKNEVYNSTISYKKLYKKLYESCKLGLVTITIKNIT